MKDYQPQIQRIKEKLLQAKVLDKDFEVFGADSHEYILNPPIDMKTVENFEQKHKVSLPIEYKLFVTQIGNGGISSSNSGAGPYYGIFPFGEEFQILFSDWDAHQLASPHLFYPKMSDEFWNDKIKKLNENLDGEEVADDEYEKREAEIFGGIFIIGTQGCTYYHGLVVNGEYAGRIINIDFGHQKPKFSYETNFLYWYEQWLDDIIEGNLTQENPGDFGYQMGGKEVDLLQLFLNATDEETKEEVLYGLLYKKSISDETLLYLHHHYENEHQNIQVLILKLLVIHHHPSAHELLKEMYDKNLLDALQITHWYIKENHQPWVDLTRKYIPTIQDKNTFDFATYILAKDEFEDFNVLKPFIHHPESSFRKTVLYTFSKAANKVEYENEFLIGLEANEPKELIQALQAIKGFKTKLILKKSQELVLKYPYKEVAPDENGMRYYNSDTDILVYITSNLVRVLNEYGLNHQSILKIDPENFEIDG